MIPADKWPEGADRHCWDADGDGRFFGIVMQDDMWTLLCEPSYIDMPPGHDWRVPVMRPSGQAPAIDLEQFRPALEHARLSIMSEGRREEIDHLLALIDGSKTAHPDDQAVDAFAAALKAKLADARAKGRGGWAGDEPGMQQRLSDMLREHVEKGDPRDVAAFCMFLHQRGEGIAPLIDASKAGEVRP